MHKHTHSGTRRTTTFIRHRHTEHNTSINVPSLHSQSTTLHNFAQVYSITNMFATARWICPYFRSQFATKDNIIQLQEQPAAINKHNTTKLIIITAIVTINSIAKTNTINTLYTWDTGLHVNNPLQARFPSQSL